MAAKFAGGLLLLVITTSILGIAPMAENTKCTIWNSSSCGHSWSFGGPPGKNDTQGSKTIAVKWDKSFVFAVWAANNPLIYENDTLVFQYPRTAGYTIYLMRNGNSYYNCEFGKDAELIANTSAGAHGGFPFILHPIPKESSSFPFYYFASKEQCTLGTKFSVSPVPQSLRW